MIFTAGESKIPGDYVDKFAEEHNLLFANWGDEKVPLSSPIGIGEDTSDGMTKRKWAYGFRTWEYPAALYYNPPKETDIVLDVGGGFSAFSAYIAKFVSKVFCIDNGKSILPLFEVWKESLDCFDTVRQGKVEVIIQDAESLPFPNKFFDKIFSFSALEHFLGNSDTLAVTEIARCLKDDGCFAGSVDWSPVSEYPLPSNPEYRAYTYDSFYQRIMKPGNFVFLSPPFHLKGVGGFDGEPSLVQLPLPVAIKCIAALCFYLKKGRL